MLLYDGSAGLNFPPNIAINVAVLLCAGDNQLNRGKECFTGIRYEEIISLLYHLLVKS